MMHQYNNQIGRQQEFIGKGDSRDERTVLRDQLLLQQYDQVRVSSVFSPLDVHLTAYFLESEGSPRDRVAKAVGANVNSQMVLRMSSLSSFKFRSFYGATSMRRWPNCTTNSERST